MRAIGEIHEGAAAEPLRQALHHPDGRTRAAAAEAIAVWRGGVLALLLVAPLETERDRDAWQALVNALGRIGTAETSSALRGRGPDSPEPAPAPGLFHRAAARGRRGARSVRGAGRPRHPRAAGARGRRRRALRRAIACSRRSASARGSSRAQSPCSVRAQRCTSNPSMCRSRLWFTRMPTTPLIVGGLRVQRVDRLAVDLEHHLARVALVVDLEQVGRRALGVGLVHRRRRHPPLRDLGGLLAVPPLDQVRPVLAHQEVGVLLALPVERLAAVEQAVALGMLGRSWSG